MSSYQINKFLQLKRLRYLDIRFSQLTPFVSIVTLLGRHSDISEDLQYWRTQEGGEKPAEGKGRRETKKAGRPNTGTSSLKRHGEPEETARLKGSSEIWKEHILFSLAEINTNQTIKSSNASD